MSLPAILGGALAALWLLDGLRLRARADALVRLTPSDLPVSTDHVFVVRPGVALDDATKRAASAHARTHRLEVLDLVSPSLSAWRAMALLMAVDPARFRGDRLARGVSAGDAILVDAALLARMNDGGELPAPRDPIAFDALARALKQHAVTSTDFAVAPALTSPGIALRDRRRLVRVVFGDFAPPVLLVQFALVAWALARAPAWGLLAVGAFALQAIVATAATSLAPKGLLAYALARPPIDLASAIGPASPPPRTTSADDARATYASLLARGTEPFFEPRRDDCPLCGGRDLRPHVAVGDRYQFKPGRFVLERCASCAHVFQNPRLSIEGLSFYYRDFYDGLGEERVGMAFVAEKAHYVQRAQMVASVARPKRWLDVGAGHGHFCCIARGIVEGATFDGLDLSDSIDAAARRGWIDRAIRGLFPDVAPQLAASDARYDVVSMSHYLEHTRDPKAEIDAAARVLDPGGLLLIEVPDPECRFGRIFGRHWMPWFQPQHQHFVRADALDGLLRAHGFEPIAWHRGEAHQPSDFTFLAFNAIEQIARPIDLPWRAPTSAATRAWHHAVWSTSFPVLGAAWLLDRATAPLLRRPGWSNTYRVLARLTRRGA